VRLNEPALAEVVYVVLALPLLLVITGFAEKIPPKELSEKEILCPGTSLPYWSATLTITGAGRLVVTCAVCPTPEAGNTQAGLAGAAVSRNVALDIPVLDAVMISERATLPNV
jgi:hypothetical protein